VPIYVFWGEDDFAMTQAIARLRTEIVDPAWAAFNDQQLTADNSEALVAGLSEAMTPPFGVGGRFVWLADTTVAQSCPEEVLKDLQRTLPVVPDHCCLVFSSRKKPDGRAKSTKLLQKHAQIREFSPIPPWKTELLLQNVRDHAADQGVNLTPSAQALLAEAVGNNTRQLWSELAKLRLYHADPQTPIDADVVAQLVVTNTQSSLQLAAAIRDGESDRALRLVAELLNRNEPALRIVATLIGQFRLWTIVKVLQEAGERDDGAIARAADLGNPKRLYFLKKELSGIASKQLLQSLPILLALEVSLKRGAVPKEALQTKVVELCQVFHQLGRRR
jgi:DNA polymerase-3 subunit delta